MLIDSNQKIQSIHKDSLENLDYDSPLYQGIVEDNQDPLKLGRIRVRIIEIYGSSDKGIPTDSLPWASPDIAPGFGQVKGTFGLIIPVVHSLVGVKLLRFNIYSPVYCSTILISGMLLSDLLDGYPKTYGHADQYSNKYVVNPDKNTIKLTIGDFDTKITCKSGAVVEIDKSGKITLTSPNEIDVNAPEIKLTGKNQIDVDAPTVNLANATQINVTSSALVNITGTQIQLGIGGAPVARVGDQVRVGANLGTIISGSQVVKSG